MKKKLLRIIAAAITAAVLLASFPVSVSAYRESADYKMVALTFDDGPSKHTDRLLDALAERGVKATFFVVGNRVATYSSQVKRIINEGHQLASHSYSHPSLTGLSYSKVMSQLESTKAELDKLGGSGVYYVRPPYGNINSNVKTAAAKMCVPLITWSVDSLDWKYLNASKTVNEIMKTVKDGDIILLHDLYSTSVDAAITVIDKLIAQGYEFVTVEELLIRRGISASGGAVYNCARNNGVNLGPDIIDPEYYDETKLDEHWAYSSITWCLDKGIFTGLGDGSFGPNKYMTRAMFVTVLGRLAGVDPEKYKLTDNADPSYNGDNTEGNDVSALPSDEVQTGGVSEERIMFPDVPRDAYYAPYVLWAAENGIVQGDDSGNFRPDDSITRQQMAAFIERYLKYEGVKVAEAADESSSEAADAEQSAPVTGNNTGNTGNTADDTENTEQDGAEQDAVAAERARASELFYDADDISEWALASVIFCTDVGAFTGTTSGEFLPKDNATRAQGTTVIRRLYRLVREEKFSCYCTDE